MKKYKLLVVDDEPSNIDLVSLVLKRFDYEVIAAPNGQKAYEIATKVLPDLVITDWEMPLMNGVELIKNILWIELFEKLFISIKFHIPLYY